MGSAIVSADQLAAFDQKVAQLGSGAAEINDFVYQHWHESNWGDLLQPAPMAVLILSNLTVAASTTDFKLVKPKGGFSRVKYSDSFRASIVQLVDTGTLALEKSYANFDHIQKRCAGVKPAINSIIDLLAGADAESQEEADENIRRFLPRQVSNLQFAVNQCLQKAQETDKMFQDLLDLTMELHQSCTATQGTNEAKLADAAMQESILQSRRTAVEEAKKQTQQQVDQSREAFNNAEKMFKDAADNMPKGWELAGLHLVDSLVYVAHAAADVAMARFGKGADEAAVAINKAGGVATVVSKDQADSTQPGIGSYQAPTIATFAAAFKNLLSGVSEDSINWDLASKEDGGVNFLRNQMLISQAVIDEPGQRSSALLERGIKLAEDLGAITFTLTRPTEDAAKLVSEIKQFALDAADFQIETSAKLGANSICAPGFAAPEAPPLVAPGALVESSVRARQAQLEAASHQLDNAREFSQTATNQLREVTSQLGEVMSKIASLDLKRIEWDEIRAILLRAISFLCELKACIADIVHFFSSIHTLVSATMSETVGRFIDLITDATGAPDKSISGVTLSNWFRQVIYKQALQAAKIARLVENIAMIYTKIYNSHVHGGVKMLLRMGRYMSGGESERAKMLDAGDEIKSWAMSASTEIQDRILEEQANMRAEIEGRRLELQKAFAGILPPAPAQMRRSIADAAEAEKKKVTSTLKDAADNKPTFKPKLGMRI